MAEGELSGIPKRKAENNTDRWGYETHFREYVLLLGRKGSEALESIHTYPEHIALNHNWYGALDRMRNETKGDGHERYALITYDENAREFTFPEISAKGGPHEVPREVIAEEIRKAKEDRGITSIVGAIHTHPSSTPFSPEDLLPLLDRSQMYPMVAAGIATRGENIFAFRTKETESINHFNVMPEKFYEFFKDYWLKKAGYKSTKDDKGIYPISFFPNIWRVSLGIAERHRLALYKGKPNEDLVRIHTDKSLRGSWSNLLQEVLQR